MHMPVVIAVILGGLVGAAWSNGFGMAVGAAVAWLLLLRSQRQGWLIAGLLQAQRVSASSAISPSTARTDAG
ncbi:MAG: hypothetical protein Q8L49_02355 [Burkholderiaceae bacterium]|nr:hypothetical protein [Burkholderiaceae bacterium]